MTKEGCETAKPVNLGLERRQRQGKKGQTIRFNGSIRLNLNHDPDALEAVLEHNGTDLFMIKKSTIPGNSGLGVFSCQNFKAGELVGYYCAKLSSGNIIRSEYAFETRATKASPRKVYNLDPNKVWMGMHFTNDPNYNKKTKPSCCKYNIKVDNKLQVIALKGIKKGEELFLDYCWKAEDSSSDEDDSSSNQDDSSKDNSIDS